MKVVIKCGAKEIADIAVEARSRLKKVKITEGAISLCENLLPLLEPFCDDGPQDLR